VARCPAFPFVRWTCRKFADPGDVATQKQRFANFGIRAPACATLVDPADRNRIYSGGRRGDPKTTFRQFWHTCTSVCHSSGSCRSKSNIFRRATSGRMSIVTWATSDHSTVGAGDCTNDVRTSVSFGKSLLTPMIRLLFCQ
jgi:hypothetical protein